MRRRRTFIIAIAAAVLVVAFVRFVMRESEPSYKGRRLASWVQAFGTTENEHHTADEAIIHIGSNAVPHLLRTIRYTPSPWKKRSMAVFKKLRTVAAARAIIPVALTTDTSTDRAESALRALRLLGPAAESAIPELTKLASDPTRPVTCERATRELILMTPVSNVAISNVLNRAPLQARLNILRYLAMMHNKTTIRQLLPSLARCLPDPDDETAICATILIIHLKSDDPRTVLALLAEAAKHPSPKVRVVALAGISSLDIGDAQLPPNLLQLLDDPDLQVRSQATNALRHCAPGALPNAPPR